MFKRYLYRNYRSSGWVSRWFAGRTTPLGWVVLIAGGVVGALGADANASMAYQTFGFLVSLVAVGFVGLIWSGRRVAVERILPKFGSVGDPLSYTVVVRNESSRTLRALVLIEELGDARPTLEQFLKIPEPGEEKRNWFDRAFGVYRWRWLISQNTRVRIPELPLPDLPPGAVREIPAELIPLRRGKARLEGVTIACMEPFGLFRALRRVPICQTILILPKRYRIAPFALPGSMKYQQGGVSLASSVGESEEFISLREYRPGDPLRRLHWKSFAKAGKPVVKEFQDEFFVRHALILDTFAEHGLSPIFEEAVSVAASLACTLQDHDSLLDLMFIGPQAFCFTSGRGVGHFGQMLEILAAVQPCRDRAFGTLESLVLEHAGEMSGCLCVLLGWDPPRQELVRMLRSRGVPVRVFVIAAADEALEPGPMADEPDHFHCLPVAQLAEKLAAL